jgi:hypothetical protein
MVATIHRATSFESVVAKAVATRLATTVMLVSEISRTLFQTPPLKSEFPSSSSSERSSSR